MHIHKRPYARTRTVCLVLAIAVIVIPQRTSIAHAIPSPEVVHTDCVVQDLREKSASPLGVKSWLVKQAVELLASAIRHGGRIAELLIEQLDDKAAKAFREHAGDIAKALEDIADIPDLSVNIVREKLRYFLTKEIKMNHGTAGVIIEGVTFILGIFL